MKTWLTMFFMQAQNSVRPLLDSGIQSIVVKLRNDKTATEESKMAAFTLVEMSIVLIVIGLIVAGISKGRGMIQAAKINAQVQQLTYFEVAYNTFQLKYDAVPGDMVNASDYWPGVANGDGNWRLSNANQSNSNSNESMKFFTHLSKAKLLKQNYEGGWVLGVGYPKLEIDNGKGMSAGGNIHQTTGSPLQLSNEVATELKKAALHLNVGRPDQNSNLFNDNIGTMTTSQAQAIDKKIDDGVARAGRFRAYRPWNSTQGDCLDATGGDYLLSNGQPACMGEYILDK